MNRIANNNRIRGLLQFDRSVRLAAQTNRLPDFARERAIHSLTVEKDLEHHDPRLIGFDEAGRGALAGPVTVACVHFNWDDLCSPDGDFPAAILETYTHLNDSKRVTEPNRERIARLIRDQAHLGIGYASALEIDHLGIVSACQIAARRAYHYLNHHREHGVDIGLFDRGLALGEHFPNKQPPNRTMMTASIQLTRGDGRSFHIAAASILAKTSRDAIMRTLDTRATVYRFAGHKGYGTAAHRAAIKQHGPSKFHRRTFLWR